MAKSPSSKKADEIALLIENEVLSPMRSAVGTFGWLEELGKTVHEIADAPLEARSDHQTARNALVRIRDLAEVIGYLAADFSNYLDSTREQVERDHTPVIIQAIGGGDHE